MTEHFFTTTAGVKIPILPISLFDLELARDVVKEQFREESEPIDPPTYEVYLELEEKSEFHSHTEATIKEGTLEEKEAWIAHQEALEKMGDAMQKRTSLVLLEGIILDDLYPEDDKWVKRRKKLFNEDVPEDEDERKIHYLNMVLLKTPADKEDWMRAIYMLSLTGAGEEAIETMEAMFQYQVDGARRPIIEQLKAELEKQKQEDVVLQSSTERRDSSEGAGNDDQPISPTTNSRSSGGDSSGEGVIEDDGVGQLPG